MSVASFVVSAYGDKWWGVIPGRVFCIFYFDAGVKMGIWLFITAIGIALGAWALYENHEKG